jgi:hypothetical protein
MIAIEFVDNTLISGKPEIPTQVLDSDLMHWLRRIHEACTLMHHRKADSSSIRASVLRQEVKLAGK